jgi:hypothetical protein
MNEINKKPLFEIGDYVYVDPDGGGEIIEIDVVDNEIYYNIKFNNNNPNLLGRIDGNIIFKEEKIIGKTNLWNWDEDKPL